MLLVLLSVIVISFSGVMMPGPMFAVALTKSYQSPLAGTKMSLGHAIIEVPLILLIYFGFTRFFQNDVLQLVLSILGGSMIIWMGINMFRTRHEVVSEIKDYSYSAFTAGIILSGLNPFFLLWWATIGSMLLLKMADFGIWGLVAFIVVHWTCDLVWLSFISITVYKTNSHWGKKTQEVVFIACSLLLVGFGIWFLVSGIKLVA